MLSNQDLAELLESTRDRVNLMGGDAPSAIGVVGVLDGLITMLRDEASPGAGDADETSSYAATTTNYAEPESEPEPEPEPEPAPKRVIPVRLRRQMEEETKPANPLLSSQYAGFFSKLIADQKAPDKERPAEDEPEEPQQPAPPARQERRPQRPAAAASSPPANSSVPPQYRGFFDALVRDQKGEPAAAQENDDDAEEPEASGNGEAFTPPPPEEPPPRSPGVWRDETSTG